LRRVEFIWSCRDTGSFGWFQTLLEEIESAQTDREWLLFHSDQALPPSLS
jgi:NADPH oxidase